MRLSQKQKIVGLLRDLLIECEYQLQNAQQAIDYQAYLTKGARSLLEKVVQANEIEIALLKKIIGKVLVI